MLPILATIVGALIGGSISVVGFGTGIGDITNRKLNNLFQAKVLTPDVVISCRMRGLITQAQFLQFMKDLGHDETHAMLLLDSSKNGLSTTDIFTLYWRFKDREKPDINTDSFWLDRQLEKNGFDLTRKKELIEASRAVPTLQDVITFAVRDVYEPEQVEQGRLLEGVPDVFITEAKERGLSEDDAKKYWAAHWNLPSMSAVYEMFHRFYPGSGHSVQFTEKDMDAFFNLADIAPGYRDRLKQLSYQPLTRVDIRRMYSMGLYGSGQAAVNYLIRDYRQLGYSPQDAARLANFTTKTFSPEKKKLTTAQILNFYVNNIWGDESKTKALELLQEGGYKNELAVALLDFQDRKSVIRDEQDKIDAYKEQYITGEISTEAELHTKLITIPLLQDKVQSLIKEFKREKIKRQSRLSRTEYDSLYRAGLINERQYRKFLQNLGYIASDIDLIISYKGYSRKEPDAVPSKDDVIGWYTSELIGALKFIRLMREIGFRDELIVLYAESNGMPLEEELIKKLKVVEINEEKLVFG